MSLHVAVLNGGWAAERPVSLKTGAGCAAALESVGYRVSMVDVTPNVVADLQALKPDVAFNAMHGPFGEDGGMQGILEMLRIPYTHSGVLASALAMRKDRAKIVAAASGVLVARGVTASRFDVAKGHLLPPPYVVKPVANGSSFGVFIVKEGRSHPPQELTDPSWPLGDEMLVEAFVKGRELTCAVMGEAAGSRALGVIEIIANAGAFYDYDSKYAPGGSTHVLPAEIKPNIYQKIQQQSVLAHDALGCRGVSRSDFRYDDETDTLIWMEVNTQPGMTETSLVPELAAHSGLSFGELVRWMVQDASLGSMRERDNRDLSNATGEEPGSFVAGRAPIAFGRSGFRVAGRVIRVRRGVGSLAAFLFVGGFGLLGWFSGGHHESMRTAHGKVRDIAARVAGFPIRSVDVSGVKELSKDEILAASGLSSSDSLLFVDVAEARAAVKRLPLVAEASVRKLYPDRIDIRVVEREPFALWQQDGKVQVVSADGTIIDQMTERRYLKLPHVVGPGARLRVREYAAILEQAPELRDRIRAGILVSERRWTLKLTNGIDVKLPEEKPAEALRQLVALEREAKVLDKDIIAVDLRVVGRVAFRLSEEAASARREDFEKRIPKVKGRA